jgi:hypothetical protein
MDICPGRRRMEQEEKGVEKKRRDWLTAGLRQGPRLATGDWRSAEHQAACSTDRVLRYSVPALAWAQDHGQNGLAGKAPGNPGSSALGRRQEPTSGKVLGSVIDPVIVSCSVLHPHLRCATGKDGRVKTSQERRSDAQSWRAGGHETQP